MVLTSRVLLVGFGLALLAACESIPEWQKPMAVATNEGEGQKLIKFRQWLWTCRGQLSRDSDGSNTLRPGQQIQRVVDEIRSRGLSTLDPAGSKTLLGTSLIWEDRKHLLMPASWLKGIQGIECSETGEVWKPAVYRGQDSALDIAILSLPEVQRDLETWEWGGNPTQGGAFFKVLASPFPGELDQTVGYGLNMKTAFHSGLDDDLLLFHPRPSLAFMGGVVINSDWRIVGYVLPFSEMPWGIAISMQRVVPTVKALITEGKVQRAYLGFKLRLIPGRGFIVHEIDVGGPAYEAGLRTQDVILKWANKDLKLLSDWSEPSSADIGRSVLVAYQRGGRTIETEIKIGSLN